MADEELIAALDRFVESRQAVEDVITVMRAEQAKEKAEARLRRRRAAVAWVLAGLFVLVHAASSYVDAQNAKSDRARQLHVLRIVEAATDPHSSLNQRAAAQRAVATSSFEHTIRCDIDADINALVRVSGPSAPQIDCDAAPGTLTGPGLPPPSTTTTTQPRPANNGSANPPPPPSPSSSAGAPAPPPTTTGTMTAPITTIPCTVGISGQGCVVPAVEGAPLHVNLGIVGGASGGFGLALVGLGRVINRRRRKC